MNQKLNFALLKLCQIVQLFFLTSIISLVFTNCRSNGSASSRDHSNFTDDEAIVQRFFNDDSFWNQPIGDDPAIDSNSDRWIKMLEQEPTGENFSPVFSKWTIPVYEADDNTAYVYVKKHLLTAEEKKGWTLKRTHILPLLTGKGWLHGICGV
jgi:hypothetical protein